LFHDKNISLGQLHEVACADPMGDEFGYNKIFHVHLEHLIGIRVCYCQIKAWKIQLLGSGDKKKAQTEGGTSHSDCFKAKSYIV
jgi:hypothetical protein